MAARRLLIVMLILLGLSTLAAALVPQHSLRGGSTSDTTTTQPTTTTTASPPAGRSDLAAAIRVGGKKQPVVAGPVCKQPKPRCEPIHVGDQLSLSVFSMKPRQVGIPEFGLIGAASPNAPALFELLLDEPITIGIVFTSDGRAAGSIQVLSAAAAAKAVRPSPGKRAKAKSRARGGSGPA